jgi:hypothetical protein
LQMRLTSVSTAYWLCVDDEAAHRMSEQSIAKAGMAENSIKMAIKKRLDAINGPNWRFQRLISLFRTNAWATFFWCDNRLKIQSPAG